MSVLTRWMAIWKTPPANFVDSETPAGAINGTNAVFTLAFTPNPPSSLLVLYNGFISKSSDDYSLSGNTITFVSPASVGNTLNGIPPDEIRCWYRH